MSCCSLDNEQSEQGLSDNRLLGNVVVVKLEKAPTSRSGKTKLRTVANGLEP
jgi:hypothetical protein